MHEWRERWSRALLAWRGGSDEVTPAPTQPDADDALEGDAALCRYAIESPERTQLLMELESARTDNEIRLAFARTLALVLRALALAGAVTGAWFAGGGWMAATSAAGASLLAGLGMLVGRWLGRRGTDSSGLSSPGGDGP